jgi:hypothetical protein
MRLSPRLRTILVCAMLEYAALVGSPMQPDEIEELLRTMNKPKVTHVVTASKADGEP